MKGHLIEIYTFGVGLTAGILQVTFCQCCRAQRKYHFNMAVCDSLISILVNFRLDKLFQPPHRAQILLDATTLKLHYKVHPENCDWHRRVECSARAALQSRVKANGKEGRFKKHPPKLRPGKVKAAAVTCTTH